MRYTHQTRGRRLRQVSALTLAALSLLAAGCTSTADQTADDSSTEAATATPELTAAQAEVDKATAKPTAIPLTTPLEAAPEPGKTIYWLKCNVNSCQDIADGLEPAAELAGWNYKELAYDSSNVATLTAAMEQALAAKPAAVALSGIPPEAGWSSMIPKYRAAGIPILASYLGPTETDDTVLTNIGGAETYEQSAVMVANWFIADSGGSGTAVLERVDDFTVLKAFSDAFVETVESGCPDCTVVEVKNTIGDIFSNNIVPSVVSKLRATPDAGYAVSANSALLEGLPSALGAAGLGGKVKVGGGSPTVANLTALESGQIDGAFTGLALHYSGYLLVDAALRHAQGMEVDPTGGGLPMQLMTEGVDFEPASSYDEPADFAEQMAALWKVS